MREKYVSVIKGLLLFGLLAVSRWLLGTDGTVFLKWWLAVLLLGVAFWPVACWLFQYFKDKGWMAAKVFGIAAAGYLTWFSANCRLLPFSAAVCRGSLLVTAILCRGAKWLISVCRKSRKKKRMEASERIETMNAVLDGELVFTVFFLLWTYVAGFRPAAYGTEKFMDYGFMMAMMRSSELPAKDLWYAGGTLNYYYGGQYFAVFLTKLTGTGVEQTYHLMRTLTAGFAFAIPFGLVRQMILDIKNRSSRGKEKLAVLGGILAGAGVSLAGNMHYVLVGKLLPWVKKLLDLPEGDYRYWFPNSTRYIGYYPAENDKTIHEFPAYSFVLGDLHAHVVNVMFVLALICLIYAMAQKYRFEPGKAAKNPLLEPYVWTFSFFIGMFHWTNYWDFVIYYVMGGLGVIYCNYLRFAYKKKITERIWHVAKISAIHAVMVFALGTLFALPFTLQFKTMVNGIALAQNHSRPYQWWMIWGLPFLFTLMFFRCVFRQKREEEHLPEQPDFFGVILGISAIGLILIPEIVYVRDIYEKEYARSNTMFKLTYQAFIMFGIVMGYGFVRLWMERRKYLQKILTTLAFLCFAGCCCYVGTAVHSWYGQVWDKKQYKGLDATAFLEKNFAEDASAIRWLNEYVEGSPVVLEAHGDSYTDYERVSAMTGLPTVLGWYVHEWLWRGGTDDLSRRAEAVKTIYTSGQREIVENLLQEYEVEYIFVGKMEREKYPELNETMIQSLGNVVYRDQQTYLVQVEE